MRNYKKLLFEDYNIPCKDLATHLLGKIIVKKQDNIVIKGRIVETECYLGGNDKASNTYNNKRTPANEPMYMKAGTCFVYMTYGMYHCINISSKEPGAAVLLRALEPITGIEEMKKFRSVKKKGNINTEDLCSGPSKLCMSLNITKANTNKVDLADNEVLWIEDPDKMDEFKVVSTSRIGIASAGEEWAKKELRFYILGNPCVSKRDKKAESNFEV